MTDRTWAIVGAPFDCGSSHAGGARAPAAIRDAGLTRRCDYLKTIGVDVVDRGDVDAPARVTGQEVHGLAEMAEYGPRLGHRVRGALKEGRVPIVLGGDHSISVATVSAVGSFLADGPEAAPLGLVWVDAHPDLETPGPGNTNALHAMTITCLLECALDGPTPPFLHRIDPAHIVFIGLRDVVAEERKAIVERGIAAHTISDIERDGITRVCQEAIGRATDGTGGFVLSFDVDALDPRVAPGVDYPQPGGLTFREAMVVMELAAGSERLRMLEMVECNPEKDPDGVTSDTAARLIHRAMRGPVL